MEPTYWLNKWERKDIGFHQNNIDPDLISHFSRWQPPAQSRILVPLCGKSNDMVWLSEKGYFITGIELSHIACKEFFEEREIKPTISKNKKYTLYAHGNIELICADLFALDLTDFKAVDAIYDCAALMALPKEMRQDYVKHLVTCCGTELSIFLIIIQTNSQVIGPPFPIDSTEINALYQEFNIQQVGNRKMDDLPERFIMKGYKDVTKVAYVMSAKNKKQQI